MAHATRGIAATFVASTLALAACGSSGENARGGGPAENAGNLAEEPYSPVNGTLDTPTRDPANSALRNALASQQLNAENSQ